MDEEEQKRLSLEDERIRALTERLQHEAKKNFTGETGEGAGRKSVLGTFDSAQNFIPRARPVAPPETPEPEEPSIRATTPLPSPTEETEQTKISDQEDLEKAKQAAFAIVKPLRTFERDIAETIRKTDASVASINLAEQKKRRGEQAVLGAGPGAGGVGGSTAGSGAAAKTEKYAWNTIISLVSVIVIIATSAIMLTLYIVYKNKAPNAPLAPPSAISTNKMKEVDAAGADREKIIKLIRDSLKDTAEVGALTEIKFVENLPAPAGKQEISSEKFLTLLAKGAPSSLLRALGGTWLFGFYSSDRSEPFILAGISSFDNAFDGMLRWESAMAGDLRETFLEYERSAGTTTTEKVTPGELKNSFEDLIVKSKNTRVLRNTRGSIVLLYSFLNEKFIVITTSEAAFKEVLNRFLTSRLVR